jgi:starch-binding outer membrane protein SusE/F
MKKINIIFIVLLCLIGFTSCEDQIGTIINSKAIDGSLSFKLNQPIYPNYVLEDANSTKDLDSLTCVQPDYGFTAAVTYSTQVCGDASFAAGTFQTLPTTVNGEKVGVNVKEMNKAIISLFGKLPNPVVKKDVYVRLKAFISDASYSAIKDSLIVKPLYSNVVKLKITPYEFPLFPYSDKSITARPWYIIGLGGKWDNNMAGLGASLIPLSVVPGNKYDLNGDGDYTYTGYFSATTNFKLVRDIGTWSPSWAMTGGVLKLNGADNITVPTSGYYTISLNSIDNTMTMVATTAPTKSYTTIGLIGAFNGWAGDVALTANTNAGSHIWYGSYTFTSADGCKFRANGNWDMNWGAGTFPYGIGTFNGSNIPYTAGKYTMILNDIDGCYYFIK